MALKSQSSRIVDDVIREGPALALKARGYRKMARSFSRLEAGLYGVLNFQASLWNTPESARFTVNLCFTLPFFHEKWTNRAFPRNPGSAASVVQERIGLLMPGKRDHWRQVSPGCDAAQVGREVTEAIERYGLPFLEASWSVRALIERLNANGPVSGVVLNPTICRAILLVHDGRAPEAAAALQALARANTHKEFGETILSVARRLDVEVAS